MLKPRTYAYDELTDDDEIPDGGSLRVPMTLMDAKRIAAIEARNHVFDANDHRPHFGTRSEAESFRVGLARESMITTARDAWRTTGRDAVKPDDPEPDGNDDPDEDGISDRERRERAYRDYVKRTNSAWKTPARLVTGWGPSAVAPGPAFIGTGPTPGETGDSISHRRLLTRDEADTMRNTAWSQMCARLRDAWKTR